MSGAGGFGGGTLPSSFGPWQPLQSIKASTYLPYSTVAALGGAVAGKDDRGTGAVIGAIGGALLGIACTTLVNWFLSQAMGGLMSLAAITLFNPLIALVLMIPVSIGGLGVNQTAYPFFYGLAGVPTGHALAVSLLMQAVIILGSLPGGVFWLRGRGKPAP